MRRIIKKSRDLEEVGVNMTPFIDIIFSLLIAFMFSNQSIFGNIDIELPPANAQIVVLEKDPVKILVQKDGSIIINNKSTKFSDLVNVVNKATLKDKNNKIYVMADRRSSYGTVLSVVGKLNENGFKDVVLISDAHNRL